MGTLLDNLFKSGDRVICKMDKEARHWRGSSCPPDDTLGTFVGRTVHWVYRGRYGGILKHQKPGIYSSYGISIIKWDNGFVNENGYTHDGWSVYLQDEAEMERRRSLWRMAEDNMPWTGAEQWIAPLPETKFYELDTVRLLPAMVMDGVIFRVRAINYQWYMESEPQNPVYDVGAYDSASGHSLYSTTGRESEMRLVKRGNVWREFNNIPFIFANIREEISYEYGRGRFTDVRNPRTNLCVWSLEEAKEALCDGVIDVLQHSNFGNLLGLDSAHLGKKVSLHGVRMDNREIGERVRAESLKGWGLQSRT